MAILEIRLQTAYIYILLVICEGYARHHVRYVCLNSIYPTPHQKALWSHFWIFCHQRYHVHLLRSRCCVSTRSCFEKTRNDIHTAILQLHPSDAQPKCSLVLLSNEHRFTTSPHRLPPPSPVTSHLPEPRQGETCCQITNPYP